VQNSQPQIEYRTAQPYVALPVTTTMHELPGEVDRGFPELFRWLGSRGVTPTGAPFIRYLQLDMPNEMKIELAAPVAADPPPDGNVRIGVLPAGRYVTLMHVGPYDGLIDANGALQRWANEQGIAWRMVNSSTWAGRVERYLTDPSEHPDPSTWQTELAYLIQG
jgi:effector-binding domain-containing protein